MSDVVCTGMNWIKSSHATHELPGQVSQVPLVHGVSIPVTCSPNPTFVNIHELANSATGSSSSMGDLGVVKVKRCVDFLDPLALGGIR